MSELEKDIRKYIGYRDSSPDKCANCSRSAPAKDSNGNITRKCVVAGVINIYVRSEGWCNYYKPNSG